MLAEFFYKAIEKSGSSPNIDAQRLILHPSGVVIVDCTDGKTFKSRDLQTLEECIGFPVAAAGRNHDHEMVADEVRGEGWATLAAAMADKIVAWKMFSNSENPRLDASVESRKQIRFMGRVSFESLESKMTVHRVNYETGETETAETTLAEYLCDPTLHTQDSFDWVFKAIPPKSIDIEKINKGQGPIELPPGLSPIPADIPKHSFVLPKPIGRAR